jgi:hypothetical protein
MSIDCPSTDEADLLRHAQEGRREAIAALQIRYSDRITRCIQQYAASAEHISAIAAVAWKEVQRQIPNYTPAQTHFTDVVDVRTKLTILRYYGFPGRWSAAIVDTVSRELQEAPSEIRPENELAELLLVMRAQQGDDEAFKQLWERHSKIVFGFLRVRVGDEIARDILSTLWLFLRDGSKTNPNQKGLDRFDPFRARFATFVKYYADHYRKQYYARGGKEILPGEIEDPDGKGENFSSWVANTLDPSQSVEERLLRAEAARRLLRALGNSTSPPHQVVIFGFNRLLEWKPREIVGELSSDLLRWLETRLERDLAQDMLLARHEITHNFQTLRQNMDM